MAFIASFKNSSQGCGGGRPLGERAGRWRLRVVSGVRETRRRCLNSARYWVRDAPKHAFCGWVPAIATNASTATKARVTSLSGWSSHAAASSAVGDAQCSIRSVIIPLFGEELRARRRSQINRIGRGKRVWPDVDW